MNIPVDFLGFADAAGAWLLTYLLHSTALLTPALLLGRWLGTHRLSLQESVLRVALIGGLLTASVQVGMGWEAATGSIPYPSARSTVVAHTAVDSRVPAPVHRMARQDVGADASRLVPAVAQLVSVEAGGALSWRNTGLALAIGLWSAMGLFLLARLGVLAVRLSRTLRGRSELSEGRVFRLFWRLLAVADVDKPTRLTRSARLDVPIALGVAQREICLPDRVVEELPQEQQETVLAHELAHLERRDPTWLLLGRAIESVLFVQPLNRVARRKLQEIAEYRCDDWAAEYTGRPLTLAKCLTAVATWSTDRRPAALAPTMAGQRSGLGQRVRRLLDPAYSGPDPRIPGWWRPIAAAGLVVVTVAVPGFSTADQEPAPEAPEPPAATTEPTPAPDPPAAFPDPVVAPDAPVAAAAAVTPAVPPTPDSAPLPQPAPAAAPTVAPMPAALAGPTATAAPSAPTAPTGPALAPPLDTPASDATPSVAPAVSVQLAAPVAEHIVVKPEVAPKIAARVVVSPATVKVNRRIAKRMVTNVVVTSSGQAAEDGQDSQDEQTQDNWDDDWDDDDQWDEELEDDFDELEDELDEMMDEIERTLEEEFEMVADELEDEFDTLEEELEETLEAELEIFEDDLESDLEAFEEEMEAFGERLEEQFESAGWESREEAFERDIEALEDGFDEFSDRLDESMDRIEAQIEAQLERILEPLLDHQIDSQIDQIEDRIDEQADRMEEMAERLSVQVRARGDSRLSAEERERLLAEARRIAEEVRPTPEEIAAIRAELDRLSRVARPSQEELDRLRQELRQQLDALGVEARQGLAKERQRLVELREKHSTR